jgi:hypothetical protein
MSMHARVRELERILLPSELEQGGLAVLRS